MKPPSAPLLDRLAEWGIEVPGNLTDQLCNYGTLLLDWNAHTNLTAIVDPDEVWVKHFADSLSCLRQLPSGPLRLIDVGSGAGFPGLVLALARPAWQITLLDSARKRVDFLSFVASELGAENVLVLHARAEEKARETGHREAYDAATARGVAELRILAEYCMPYVRVGGRFLAMKGPDAADEVAGCRHAIQVLGGRLTAVDAFELPGSHGARSLVVIEKTDPTPDQYPRRAGVPERKPL